MRSKPMLICSGVAGAVLASSLLLTPAVAQQVSQEQPIDLRFDAEHTSRRSNPLDLFNLNSQRSAATPHYTSANQPNPLPVAVPAAPVVALPLTEVNLLEQEADQDDEDKPGDDAAPQTEENGSDDAGDDVAESEERRRQLNPDQGRPLSVEVVAINVGKAEVGTGVLPEGAARTTATTSYLPTGVERGAMFTCVHWRPSLVRHFPLYFEDAMLERHGHVRWGHLQSVASGIKFYSTIPLMPYLRTLRPKHECLYQVGHYRAGSCAPVLKDHLPYDKHAAVVEGLALAGFFWAMPL